MTIRRPILNRSACVAGLVLVAWPALVRADPACFGAADNRRLTFQVLQNAPTSKSSRQRPYAYYPQTGVASMQLQSVVAPLPGTATYYFQWANRANTSLANADGEAIVRKANLQPSFTGKRKQRSAFTSVARADACTLAQTAGVLGWPDRAAGYARAAGIRLVGESAQPDAGSVGPPDTCIAPAGSLAPVKSGGGGSGVLLDYEVQDGRTPAQTTAFLRQWAQLVHDGHRPAILLTNPIDAPTQVYTGVTADNAHTLVETFDLTTILLWSRNPEHDLAASYEKQKAAIAAGGKFDGSRVLIDFELAGTTLEDARFVRRAIVADHLAGVFFWRNGARQGGMCTSDVNARIAAIAFGDGAP
ncbi:hypothetical protein [Novosphingobium sp.]|uniref:hypothetical protein n=1 Tax=Novosphingobium sp. TaxID=1874826 RepID=UPI003D134840